MNSELNDVPTTKYDTSILDNIRLIGISGKLGSGKTSFSRYMRQYLVKHEAKSYAEKLREMVSLATNIPIEKTRSLEDKERYFPPIDMTLGELLQKMGTDGMRKGVHPDFWVFSLFQYYDKDLSYWIIDDVRFPNEADQIKKLGGIVIRLEGDPDDIKSKTSRDLGHISETALDDYEHFDLIMNTEKAEYYKQPNAMFENVLKTVKQSRTTGIAFTKLALGYNFLDEGPPTLLDLINRLSLRISPSSSCIQNDVNNMFITGCWVPKNTLIITLVSVYRIYEERLCNAKELTQDEKLAIKTNMKSVNDFCIHIDQNIQKAYEHGLIKLNVPGKGVIIHDNPIEYSSSSWKDVDGHTNLRILDNVYVNVKQQLPNK